MKTKATGEQGTTSGSPARRWISYRPEIKLLDCTIRDGGLMNDHAFTTDVVKAVYSACVQGGVDYMELGYKASKRIFSPDEYGKWKFCTEEDIRNIVGENDSSLKLSVMADAERTDYHEDILPCEQSVLDMVRVATYIHQVPIALDIVKDAHDKGYETCINLMASSTIPEWELDEALDVFANSEVDGIYLVDSFGAFYSEQVQYLLRKFLQYGSGWRRRAIFWTSTRWRSRQGSAPCPILPRSVCGDCRPRSSSMPMERRAAASSALPTGMMKD